MGKKKTKESFNHCREEGGRKEASRGEEGEGGGADIVKRRGYP